MSAETKPVDVLAHRSAVLYWVNAAREQSRWGVRLAKAYKAETHGRRRGSLWLEGVRCRDRVKPMMAEARRVRAALARVGCAK